MSTTYEIHPAIGVARMGDSTEPDGFFLAPEPGLPVVSSHRDAAGNLKRQAARFRIFRCERDENGRLTNATEISMVDSTVEWTVTLANRKSCGPRLVGVGRRNDGSGDDEKTLSITPGSRTLKRPKGSAQLDDGKFRNTSVSLGEIRTTDPEGHLLILGGAGKAGSDPTGRPIQHFADNEDWYDDASDGKIEARVIVNGTEHIPRPAWVVVGPPDFAPQIENVVTWYDVAMQGAVERGWRQTPIPPSFEHDIKPILARFVQLRWTNPLFFRDFGPGSSRDFASKWQDLADPAKERKTREDFFKVLRRPLSPPQPGSGHLPRLNDDKNDGDTLWLTPLQYGIIEKWAAHEFKSDLGEPPASELLPDALDRVSLQACVGGAFFPGIEAGQFIADKNLYVEPFRFDADKLRPGQLTEGNAVPWQADFSACRTDTVLGWWPAQRPDDVFLDPEQTETITVMKRWLQGVQGVEGAKGLIENYGKLGIVKQVVRADGKVVFIENERILPPRP
jgi:hypothetical protein